MSFWAGRRVFVTGHTGFKGSWLTLWLRGVGAKVTGYALAPATTPNLYELACVGDDIRSVIADIRDAPVLRQAMVDARAEVVFHLAAQSLVRTSYELPLETYDVNVIGTASLLDAVRTCDSVRAVVIVTSDKCYDNREWSWGYRETDSLGGHDPYSSSKACAEIVTAAYRSSFFAAVAAPRVATARAGNVIGGGDWARDRLIPDLINAFVARKKPVIRNRQAIRPWQFVLEPLHGYMLLAECLCGSDGAEFADAWNFGPDDRDSRPVAWIADRIRASWGNGAAFEGETRPQPAEAHSLKLDSSKARARLGWSPHLDIETSIEWTVRWYRDWASDSTRCAELARRDIAAYSTLINEHASLPLL